VTAAAATLGTTLAWLVTRADLPGGRAWRLLTPLPARHARRSSARRARRRARPGGLVAELARPLGIDRLPQVEGFPAAFAVLTLLSYPYVLLPVAARLASLPPSLEESARLLGRRPANVFRTIVLPAGGRRRVGGARCSSSSTSSPTSAPSPSSATTP
jgi:iron(III) transport system permease protein